MGNRNRKRKTPDKVVPLKARVGLVLTEDERLRMENLVLKMQLVQQSLDKKIAPLIALRDAIGAEAGKRLGIEIQAYEVNLDSGVLTPINGGPAPAED